MASATFNVVSKPSPDNLKSEKITWPEGDRASFEDLTRDWVEAPQLLKNVRVRQKVPLETLPAIQATMTEVEHELQGTGRLVVRYSGTEPLLRVMIESDSTDKNERLMNRLLETIRKQLG